MQLGSTFQEKTCVSRNIPVDINVCFVLTKQILKDPTAGCLTNNKTEDIISDKASKESLSSLLTNRHCRLQLI